MSTLTIVDFSCLKDATLTLAPVNVIIGPQGSGKSITTKLFYFLSEILTTFLQSTERGESLEDFKRQLAKQFSAWFPPAAWGPGRINVSYTSGEFSVRVLRRKSQGRMREDVTFTFSEWFNNFYRSALDLFNGVGGSESPEGSASLRVRETLDKSWRARELLEKRFASEIGEPYIAQQTFIPAGRAFFTSIGRLVAGFEQAGSLDPVTIKFARLFANLRDRNARRYTPSRLRRFGQEYMDRRANFMTQLFGGELKFDNDDEFVETSDGRKVLFSSLSSGQQELLPMWSLLDYFAERDAMRLSASGRIIRRYVELVYIEEPEAHLFPSAQSLLMEFLIGSIASEKFKRNLVLTTHSPYIMGKFNVFLKAGQLARRKKRNQEINDIVPRECWLDRGQLSALAIEDGRIREIIDDDGLIDSTYLDQVSEDISRDFSRLLKIEAGI